MSSHIDNSSGTRLAILVEGGLGIVAVVLAWLLGVELREQFPASADETRTAILRGALATLPLVTAFWWLVHANWPATRRLREQVRQLVSELFPRATVAVLALIAVLAGVSEELLFRGVLQSIVGRWTTPVAGLVIASLIFGLLHAMSRLYFVLATLVGAYFGWLFYQFHDLTAPIIAHALYDFVALVYLTRRTELFHERPSD